MTATETNIVREDNPNTNYNESSSSTSPSLNRGGKDIHEGYGIINIDAALEALNVSLDVGQKVSEKIVSSIVNSSGRHAFARRISLEQNKSYLFNLTYSGSSDLDLYLYSNASDPDPSSGLYNHKVKMQVGAGPVTTLIDCYDSDGGNYFNSGYTEWSDGYS